MKRKLLISIIVILGFLIYRYSKFFYAYVVLGKEAWETTNVSILMSILLLTGMVVALLCTWYVKGKPSFHALGLKKDILQGLMWGAICSLPMFIGYYFTGTFNTNFDLELIYRDIVLAGFGEEFIFRGFLFGLLFFYAGWGFIPACLISSLFFGAGHLYQAENVSSVVMIFLFTALANAGFAYFYYAWNSLWMVIFLHGFMDLAWDTFSIAENVTGNTWANVFRFVSLGIAIFISVKTAKKNNRWDLKSKMWVNKTA